MNLASTPLSGSSSLIATLNVPAGSYVVFASVRLFGQSGSSSNAECLLGIGGSGSSTQNVNLGPSPDRKTVSPLGSGTLASAGAVQLWCDATTGSPSADEASLVAIRVGTLN